MFTNFRNVAKNARTSWIPRWWLLLPCQFCCFSSQQNWLSCADNSLIKVINEFLTATNVNYLRSWLNLANQRGPVTFENPTLPSNFDFSWKRTRNSNSVRQLFMTSHSNKCAKRFLCAIHLYDPSRQTLLQTDSSCTKSIGFSLKQKQDDGTWHLFQCCSRWLSEAENRYAMFELELLSVVCTATKIHLFVEGLPQFDV